MATCLRGTSVPSEHKPSIQFPLNKISPYRLSRISGSAKRRFPSKEAMGEIAESILQILPQDEKNELTRWAIHKSTKEHPDYYYWIVFAFYDAALPRPLRGSLNAATHTDSLFAIIQSRHTARGTFLPLK